MALWRTLKQYVRIRRLRRKQRDLMTLLTLFLLCVLCQGTFMVCAFVDMSLRSIGILPTLTPSPIVTPTPAPVIPEPFEAMDLLEVDFWI